MQLLTVGHGTLEEEQLGGLLSAAGVARVVDVRRAPGSRRHPHFSRAALEQWLPELGIGYMWEPRLGGWRKAAPDSPNTALRNRSFRGYADYMGTTPFWEALDGVLAKAGTARSAVMCSESVYWRCHRRLIADAAELARGAEVLHLAHDGRLSPHRLTDGAREAGGLVIYDGGSPSLLDP